MDSQIIDTGDNVRHKTKCLNGNLPMNVSDVKNNQALCDHFEPNEEGGTTHKQSWLPLEQLDKVIYGND